ncbi:beta-citryl-glutamate synthase B-like protein, partial [Cricetulus griseus]
MCSSVAAKLWFLTDRRIREDYPQKEILRALKAKCCEEELDFRAVVMDEVVLTIEQGNLDISAALIEITYFEKASSVHAFNFSTLEAE